MEQAAERQAVLKALEAYGIGPDASIDILSGGTANRNYIVRADGETRILRKRSAKYSNAAWIDYEEAYLLHMGKKGISVPVPLPAAGGALRCLIGTDTFQLFPYMSGERHDPLNREELADAGAFLGRLHRAADDFRPGGVKALPRYDDPAVIADALTRVSAERNDLAPAERCTLEAMIAGTERVRSRLPDERYAALPHTIVHGDYHPANVAFCGGRVCVLYDFDWISPQPRLRDIADLAVYFAALRDEPFDGGSIYSLNQPCTFDLDRAGVALRAYVRSAGPLEAAEAGALADFMAARLLHSRVQALAKVPPERAVGVLVGGIEPALEWLERQRGALAGLLVQGGN